MITDRIPDNAPKKKLRPRNVFDVAKPASCLSDIEMAVFSVNSRVSWNDANNKHVKENRNRNTHKIMLRRGLTKFTARNLLFAWGCLRVPLKGSEGGRKGVELIVSLLQDSFFKASTIS